MGGESKPVVKVDVTSDTVCPWCFVGKKNLEQAISAVKDKYDVQVQWHPYQLNPGAPKEGVLKLDYYKAKFGEDRVEPMLRRMTGVFGQLGYQFSMGGLTGNTLDSHRLLVLAARQGLEKQNALAEELFLNYFTQEKYIGDRQVLLAAAEKAGVTGAEEWLSDPKAGLQEVQEELRTYARGVTGVPHFRIGNLAVSGAQPPEVLVEALEDAAVSAT